MPKDLIRHQQTGNLHFLTFSCHTRKPYLNTPQARDLFEHSLETIRQRHTFSVIGYVVMPEHVHLLLSEPQSVPLAKALQALKLSVTRQRSQNPFWQPRYYDFNVFSERKRVEKLQYMHRNPVTRGLVNLPEDWPWSSYHHWIGNATRPVQIDFAPGLASMP